MLVRNQTPSVLTALDRFPAVVLTGPRQVGKTTLAHNLADSLGDRAVYLDLELPSDRKKLGDPEVFFTDNEDKLIVLDEIHREPEIFRTLRGVIDRRRRKGHKTRQFLLLGSASIDLLNQSSESLAGRLVSLEMTPLTAAETGADSIQRLWTRGGFPNSFLAPDDAASLYWRDAFIQTYLERDVPLLGPRIPSETLFRFWQMLAHNQGQLLNAARYATSLSVSGQTIARYLDVLVDLLLVRRLPPWSSNVPKRLVRSPKVYVRDSGVVHALLGIKDHDQLLGHPVSGFTWEGLIIENIIAAIPAGATSWFYRTAVGAEIDLVIEFPGGERWAIEIKRSLDPSPSKGFGIACEDIQAKKRSVVYPGSEPYRISRQVEAMPLEALVKAARSRS